MYPEGGANYYYIKATAATTHLVWVILERELAVSLLQLRLVAVG